MKNASTDDSIQDNGIMTLYLQHDKGTDNEDKNKLVNANRIFTYDIQKFMVEYKREHNAYPNKVVIKVKTASDGYTLPTVSEGGNAESVWTKIEIDAAGLNK
ncbi:hypothetical protein EVA_12397 [gut metagenome]|uniref:Uncharacterized protein n=1 Tax=gut metagenome TaxID=749906 RepID=J9FWW1_9ZZZZ